MLSPKLLDMSKKVAHWFRRDLRLEDNAALYHALKSGFPVVPVFIFDREILDELPPNDARVTFIYQQIHCLQQQLTDLGSSLVVVHGHVFEAWKSLTAQFELEAVYTNHDYEPYARHRDTSLAGYFQEKGISFHTFKDQVLLEKNEVLTQAGKPYTVFTPYSRNWRSTLSAGHLQPYPTVDHFSRFFDSSPLEIPSLESMGFETSQLVFPGSAPDKSIIRTYDQTRNFPAVAGVTRMGIHLRFGTVSIRQLAAEAQSLNDTYLNELIWREFYMQILWNFPHVVNAPFRPEYAAVPWRNAPEDFDKWCKGKTGYPLVDAGMRELNATGYMHNRVRMVVASFLTKHLLLDWRKGEAYFAEKLLDFELSSNNGGWQWAAGCGTDAAPYFRIFNPEEQLKKFDSGLKYVRKWVPEFGTPLYPSTMVDHKFARERCLEAYKSALKGA